MYLTAQRVVAHDTKPGINVFLHMHTGCEQPVMKSLTAIISVAEKNTGVLVAESCAVPPGGNRVKSYIDIVADDNTTQDGVVKAIHAARAKTASSELPFQAIVGSVGIRFGAEIGLSDLLVQEYDDVASAALVVFGKWLSKK